MKTESQEFNSLLDYCGSDEAEKTINALYDHIGDGIDDIYCDMLTVLGEETTDEAVEEYLSDDDHIEKLIGWDCIRYSSEDEQDYEEELAWREICEWDDR